VRCVPLCVCVRSDFTTVSVSGSVYVLGGCSVTQQVSGYCPEVTNHFSSYDVTADVWTVHANAPNNRTRYQAASANGKIYYIGGRDAQSLQP
jgi:N-acetylneuraminic acid mutarotase